MASITVTYIWDSGDSVNIHMDSDLESTAELREQAAAMWRDTWASLEDNTPAAPNAEAG